MKGAEEGWGREMGLSSQSTKQLFRAKLVVSKNVHIRYPPASASLDLNYRDTLARGFYLGARDLNSGSHVCAGSAFLAS